MGRPLATNANFGPAAADVAKFIVLNAQQSKSQGPGSVKNEPSWMSRIFDILSRPNYAVANLVKDAQVTGFGAISDFNPLKSIISGLAGTQKTTFQDVLKANGMEPGLGTSALGFVLDVGLDPTTYIPGAAIGKVGKLVGLGKKTEEAAKDLPLGQRLLDRGEPIHPDAFGLPPRPTQPVPEPLRAQPQIPTLPDPAVFEPKPGFTTPQLALDLPGVKSVTGSERRITIPDDLKAKLGDTAAPVAKEVTGQIPFKLPGFSAAKVRKAAAAATVDKAHQIVQGVAKGNIEDALKLVPAPHPVPGVIHNAVADSIVKHFNPDLSSAVINKLAPDSLNAMQQVKLWHKAREYAVKQVYRKGRSKAAVDKAIFEDTAKIYKAVENKFTAAGKVPRIGTGDNVALSDVIGDLTARGVPVTDDVLHEFSHAIKPGSELSGAIERLRARGAITDSIPAKEIVDAIGKSKAGVKALGSLSGAETKNFDKFLKDFAKFTAKQAKISPAGIKATDKLVNMTLDAGKSAATMTVQRMGRELEDVVAKGKTNLAVNRAVTLALEKDMGKLPAWAVNDNKALEFVMGRFATWWGQNDLRPMSLNAIASAAATAEARGNVLTKIFRGYELNQKAEAFRLAQGLGEASSPEVQKLSEDITKMMSDMLNQASGTSVLIRSGVNMDLLNKWMRRMGTGFQFSRSGKFTNPITGVKEDFSKGSDWLNSWKSAEVTDDPSHWMFKTMEAIEQATREKALFEDMGERFGSSMYGKEFTTKIEGHPYLEGYYFPPDIAKQIPRVIKDWTVGSASSIKMIQLYDKVLSMWKTLATIYRPAHHIRNLVGDVYMGALDGVVSVKPYRLALRVQRQMKGAYETMQDVDRLVEIGALSNHAKAPLPGTMLFRNKSGIPFTAEQIAAVAHQKGLFEHVKTLEDIIDLGSDARGIAWNRPLGGAAARLARGASELESHNTRLAHFIDVIMKSRGNDLPKIFEDAARRSRKFHPSGLDLTHFEKTVLRRLLPFYSWMRKSAPVLLEGMVMKPGITVIPAKLGEALQMANGIDTTRDNPFPVDQMFPKWLRDEGIGPIGLPDGLLGNLTNQSPAGYVQAGVGLNPLSQLIEQLQAPGKTVGSSLSPAIQVPLELGITGRKTFTGEPITGPDARPGALQQYIGEQIPIWSAIQGVSGITPFGTDTKRAAQSNNQSGMEALINWLTGAGVKGTGPYIKSALYEKKAPLLSQRAGQKQDFLSELRSRLGE